MTTMRSEPSLSRNELIVLARLSANKPPSPSVLAEIPALAQPGESPAQALARADAAITALRRRGLVNAKHRTLTDDGARALRTAFELAKTPTWKQVRTDYLPALTLGLKPGSEPASQALETGTTLALAVLRTPCKLPGEGTLAQFCDALIIKALGMTPGAITVQRIRTHMFAQHASAAVTGEPEQIAMRIADKVLRATKTPNPSGASKSLKPDKSALEGKLQLVAALGRRWAYAVVPVQNAAPVQSVAPVQNASAAPSAQRTLRLDDSSNGHHKPPAAPPADMLLTLVREAIPRIGSDGRFGAEKVFVSAIWHRIERDSRISDLSLDRFKRWLVSANRDQLIDLARADLAGMMDAKLVAESEIHDLGATFHFVVDRRSSSRQGIHAR